MIAVDGITKRYDELIAVDDLSFEIAGGEVVGFLGPNGAGKSTTMKVLTGTLEPDEGAVLFDGVSIGDDLPAARSRVGYLPETNALYPEMLVSEYLEYTCELRGIRGRDRTRALARAVEETGVGPVFVRPVSQISKGFRQRVGLAAAIVHEPEILVLDEPTEGLDPNQRVGIRRLVSQLGHERTVLLSTHVLAEVEATCNRLLIIHRGKLVADGSPADLLADRSGGASYLMEAAGENVEERVRGLPGVLSTKAETVEGRTRVTVNASGAEDLRPVLFRLAVDAGWALWELHRERASLEGLFRDLTTEASTEGAAVTPDPALERDEPAPDAIAHAGETTMGGGEL